MRGIRLHGETMDKARKTIGTIVFCGLLFLQTAAIAKEPEERDWIEVKTEHFRLYSALNEAESVDLVRQLETFRRVISMIANLSNAESPIPTEIIAMRGRKDFVRIGAPKLAGGIFVPGLRNNLIVIRDVPGADEVSTMVHEYAHFLLGGHSKRNYPRWFNEGLAEYVSAPQERPGLFVVGAVHEGRVMSMSRFRWIPLREVIDPQDMQDWSREQQVMFYASSWALVHYLHHGPNRKTLPQDLDNYIKLLDAGTDKIEAFEDAFNMSVDELDKDVRAYFGEKEAGVRTIPGYVLDINDIVPEFEPNIREVSKEEISLALAHAALTLGEIDEARHWFTIASESPELRADAEAGIGDTYKFQENFETALPYFESSIALAPDDPYIQLDYAEYWHDFAKETENMEERAAHIVTARKHYVAAWKLDNTMPETYAMYGDTFLLDSDNPDKAVEMLQQAEALLPSSIVIRLLLAEAYAASGDLNRAADEARSVLAWIHGESEAADRAREILDDHQQNVEHANQ